MSESERNIARLMVKRHLGNYMQAGASLEKLVDIFMLIGEQNPSQPIARIAQMTRETIERNARQGQRRPSYREIDPEKHLTSGNGSC